MYPVGCCRAHDMMDTLHKAHLVIDRGGGTWTDIGRAWNGEAVRKSLCSCVFVAAVQRAEQFEIPNYFARCPRPPPACMNLAGFHTPACRGNPCTYEELIESPVPARYFRSHSLQPARVWISRPAP